MDRNKGIKSTLPFRDNNSQISSIASTRTRTKGIDNSMNYNFVENDDSSNVVSLKLSKMRQSKSAVRIRPSVSKTIENNSNIFVIGNDDDPVKMMAM